MSSSIQNLKASETGMLHQEVHQFVNQFPQQSNAFCFGEESQLGNLDQQPRIRLPGFQNDMQG